MWDEKGSRRGKCGSQRSDDDRLSSRHIGRRFGAGKKAINANETVLAGW